MELPTDSSGVNELQEVSLAEIAFIREFFGELFTPFDDGSEVNQSINMSALNNYAVVVHGEKEHPSANRHPLLYRRKG